MKSLLILAALGLCVSAELSAADGFVLHTFQRHELTDGYYSEGIHIGDLNRDGRNDVVHGPFWFAGPDFRTRREIYPAVPQPRERYANNFFSWVYDFNGDGWNDVFVVGFPGTPAYVYENPTESGFDRPWKKHQVFDFVANESPQFVQLVGDDRPELVCTREGMFGYASVNWNDPFAPWTFHPVSAPIAPKNFGHGLGVGDLNGDGRPDVLLKDGWLQQPEQLEESPRWEFHPVSFAAAGGADMFAYDVDGDGDQDVITSLAAHEFGLAWYEQYQEEGERAFRRHLIMGSKPEENPYGVLFSELHALALADLDGDGLKDIVTGKTYWSHHRQSPMWDAGAVVYWFKLTRGSDGVDWIPYRADGEAGIGRQLVVGDLNADGLPDLAMGGMKGANVLMHQRKVVEEAVWRAHQPRKWQPLAAGLDPQAAAERMLAPPGFHVQLAAGEPQVHQPIAFTFDPRGRVWVAEAYTYPNRAPEGEGRDKIVILEDTDGNGSLDKRTVFAEGLNLVSGLELGFGGVWVGAAPYLLFIPDRNGDDVPDGPPETLLDGFGFQDTHETLNAFIWGPDGWLYGCHGVFTHSRVGKPGMPDEERVPLNAGVWRYHPTRHKFEVFAWGTSNPWGVDFNDHGQAFITACVIPHLWHVIQGARYQRQGGQHFDPYFYEDIQTIADHAHYVGKIADHAWWGHEPSTPGDTLAAGGGHAHCGAMIYLGDNFPAVYRNQLFMNNVHGNRVNQDRLERRGSGFVGRHGLDLLVAQDRWFRGINLKYGPDGSVYLIDWYDPNACHRTNPEIWDRSNGRVYRLSYGMPEPRAVDLEARTDLELAELQLHANDWQVRMARRLLQERSRKGPLAAAARARLEQILASHPDVTRRLRALWALHACGAVGGPRLRELMADSEEYVRAWAIQLATEQGNADSELLAALAEAARKDPSPVVRLYLAAALQRTPAEQRWEIAAALLMHGEDAEDANLPLMYWYACEPLVPLDAGRALDLAAATPLAKLTRFITRRAASQPDSLERVLARIVAEADPLRRKLLVEETLAAQEGRVDVKEPAGWTRAYEVLQESDDPSVRDQSDQLAVVFGDRRVLPKMRQLILDQQSAEAKRRHAFDILVRARDPQSASVFQTLLQDDTFRGAAIRALAAYDDPRTPPALLERYGSLSDAEKRDAISTLVSRPAYALQLLDAVERQQVARTDLHAYHVQQLSGFEDETLRNRIASVWGAVRATAKDKQEEIARLKKSLGGARLRQADLGNGRRLFAKTCATCHTLFGEGEKVGPDITGSNRANLDYILENVVDPSAVLGKDYRLTILTLNDGRVVSGLVQKETDSGLTVRTINDTVLVAKADVEERQLSDVSMMPERLLDQLQPAEVRDLIAYLGSPTQVPLRGPRPALDDQTGTVAGGLEGESLKIVGKTRGEARSQSMSGFAKDRWSGNHQLWWTGAAPGDQLDLEIPVEQAGSFELEVVFTRARDYGIVQLLWDGKKLGEPLDLFHAPEVITTGVLTYPVGPVTAGEHTLSVQIVGAHPEAVPAHMCGLDFVKLVPLAAVP